MNRTELKKLVARTFQYTCEGQSEVGFRGVYSGRAMYGKRCIGVTGHFEDIMKVIGEVIKDLASRIELDSEAADMEDQDMIDQDDFDDAVDAIMNFSMDSMGLNTIVYWPRIDGDGIESGQNGEEEEG